LNVQRLVAALGTIALLALCDTAAADAPQEGRWRELPETAVQSTDAQRIEQLESIGYLRGTREETRTGVSVHLPAKAHQGLNLYTSAHAPEATLMDMEGRTLHTWRFPYQDAFGPPKQDASGPPKSTKANAHWWRRIHLYSNGDLLAIFSGLGMVKIDKNSELLWSSPLQAHHDVDVQPNGDIYVLTRVAHMIPRIHPSAPILEDFISVLGPDGVEKQRISLLEAFENSPHRKLIFEGKRKEGDLFHTNTVGVLDGRIAATSPPFAKGRVLTSMNALGVVAVVDLPSRSIVWLRKTPPVGQHDPQVLANGNLLLFENHEGSGHSRVVEIDPVDFTVRWSYGGSDEQPLYSKFLGAVQRLPNGNTLITESDAGRAVEVTPEGEIVWQFHNPKRAGDRDQYIATLPEVLRLPAGFAEPW
jgi:outer membrane protein assembly factor BamB